MDTERRIQRPFGILWGRGGFWRVRRRRGGRDLVLNRIRLLFQRVAFIQASESVFIRSFKAFPTLKHGNFFGLTETGSPVFGFLPRYPS